MDIISFNEAATANGRIEKFNANPDSNSGVLTQPKVIEAGETVTIKSGRQAILADTVVEGDLVIEAGGDVFVPAGAGFSDLDERINNIQTLPIGAILNGYTIFDNCIVAFGGEFNRTDYPKLWAYLQANPTLLKTQAEWQAQANAQGGICGFFSSGDGTATFRVPNLDKAFLRPDSRGVGSYQEDTFQGHYHNIREIVFPAGSAASFGNDGVRRPPITGTPIGEQSSPKAITANTDGINGTPRVGNETRPKNIAVLPLIVAK